MTDKKIVKKVVKTKTGYYAINFTNNQQEIIESAGNVFKFGIGSTKLSRTNYYKIEKLTAYKQLSAKGSLALQKMKVRI